MSTDEVKLTGETVTLEPDWANMRRYVLFAARTDLPYALEINAALGCEGVGEDELQAVANDR